MTRPRKNPPRGPATFNAHVDCSRCHRAWEGTASRKTLAQRLLHDGWSYDLETPGAWMCPECSAELVPDPE